MAPRLSTRIPARLVSEDYAHCQSRKLGCVCDRHSGRIHTTIRTLALVLCICLASTGCEQDDAPAEDADKSNAAGDSPTAVPAEFSGCDTQGGFFKIAKAKTLIDLDAHFNAFSDCVMQPGVRVACGRVAVLPDTHICIFRDHKDMNLSLYRASHAIEIESVILSDKQLREHTGYDGHDLAGADLDRYHEKYLDAIARYRARATQDAEGEIGYIEVENEFREMYLEPELSPNTILIAGFLRDDLDMIISHELYHAQFFSDESYRKAVMSYWDTEFVKLVGATRKEKIRAVIAAEYDVKRNPLLLYNEFQAYALQLPLRSGRHDLISLMQPYKKPLTEYLTAQGVPPMQFAPPPGNWATFDSVAKD